MLICRWYSSGSIKSGPPGGYYVRFVVRDRPVVYHGCVDCVIYSVATFAIEIASPLVVGWVFILESFIAFFYYFSTRLLLSTSLLRSEYQSVPYFVRNDSRQIVIDNQYSSFTVFHSIRGTRVQLVTDLRHDTSY